MPRTAQLTGYSSHLPRRTLPPLWGKIMLVVVKTDPTLFLEPVSFARDIKDVTVVTDPSWTRRGRCPSSRGNRIRV